VARLVSRKLIYFFTYEYFTRRHRHCLRRSMDSLDILHNHILNNKDNTLFVFLIIVSNKEFNYVNAFIFVPLLNKT
jgi:hypothetical protein